MTTDVNHPASVTFEVRLKATQKEHDQVADPKHKLTATNLRARLRPTLKNNVSNSWFLRGKVHSRWTTATVEAIAEAGLLWERFENARITFLPVFEPRCGGDTGATALTEDGVLDGIVEAGLIPDDNRYHVHSRVMLAPINTSWSGFVVKITEKPIHPDHEPADICGCRESMQLMQRANEEKKKNAAKAKRRSAKPRSTK